MLTFRTKVYENDGMHYIEKICNFIFFYYRMGFIMNLWRKCMYLRGKGYKYVYNVSSERYTNKIVSYKYAFLYKICRYTYNVLAFPANFAYKLCHTIDSTYLCIKYPFLYPRHRMYNLHYVNHNIHRKLTDLYSKAYIYASFDKNYSDDNISPIDEVVVKTKKEEDSNVFYFIDKKGGYNELLRYEVKDGIKKNRQYTIYLLSNKKFEFDEYVWTEEKGFILYKPYNLLELTKTYADIVINKKYQIYYKILKWLYYNPVQWIHFIPTHSELDAMDEGWRRSFGIKMCDEIKQQLKKDKYLYKYRITQIKEKWGALEWYSTVSSKELMSIINKYNTISSKTCIYCGNPAKYITGGYVLPYCEDCLPENSIIEAEIKNDEIVYNNDDLP